MTWVWAKVLLASWHAGWFATCMEIFIGPHRPQRTMYWLLLFTGLWLWWPVLAWQMFRAARNPE